MEEPFNDCGVEHDTDFGSLAKLPDVFQLAETFTARILRTHSISGLATLNNHRNSSNLTSVIQFRLIRASVCKWRFL